MIWSILLLLTGSVVLSCSITPPIFYLINLTFDHFPWPYSRVFDRVILVVLLVMLWLMRRRFTAAGIGQFLKEGSLALCANRFFFGALLSLSCSYLLTLLFIDDGTLVWRHNWQAILISKLPKVIIGAMVVAVLEEFFFRAVILRSLCRVTSRALAIACGSFLYSVVHFITPIRSFIPLSASPIEGFRYMGVIIERLALPGVTHGIIGLFLVGVVLSILFLYGGSFWLCAGLHAGWICSVKSLSTVTRASDWVVFAEATGTRYFLVAHPYGWFSIILVGLMAFGSLYRQRRKAIPLKTCRA